MPGSILLHRRNRKALSGVRRVDRVMIGSARGRPRETDVTPLNHFAMSAIGGSMGGVGALQTFVAGLPADIPAALLVAQHIGRNGSILPDLLRRRTRLPVIHARQAERVRGGQIYVAPPDHHLLLEDG